MIIAIQSKLAIIYLSSIIHLSNLSIIYHLSIDTDWHKVLIPGLFQLYSSPWNWIIYLLPLLQVPSPLQPTKMLNSNDLEQGSAKCSPQVKSVFPPVFRTLIDLCIVAGCSRTTRAGRLHSCLHSLKYILYCVLQKVFANPWFRT